MANVAKFGYESARMPERKGEQGYIPWRIEVLPELKDKCVMAALDRGVTLKSLVNEALDAFDLEAR